MNLRNGRLAVLLLTQKPITAVSPIIHDLQSESQKRNAKNRPGTNGGLRLAVVLLTTVLGIGGRDALAQGCLTPSFASATNFSAGSQPRSVAVGDFNLDGKPDLAVANSSTETVSVLLGDGAGAFGAATNFAVSVFINHRPQSVAVGDFNLDGKPDLATANGFSTVSVLLGNGSGGFGAAGEFSTASAGDVGASAPLSIAVGDFNLDGKPDAAMAHPNGGGVSVMLGNGVGGLGAATGYPVQLGTGGFGDPFRTAFPISVAVGDFNLDGKPDLTTANQEDSMSVLLGNGAGGFGAATFFGTGTFSNSVAVGDFNSDGKPDVSVANSVSTNVSVFLGNGSGAFGPRSNFGVGSFPAFGSFPTSVAIGDFNLDGKPDLVTANLDSNVSVLLGNGSGAFGPTTNFGVGPGIAFLTRTVAVGDFNLDGKPDLATTNWNFAAPNNVSVLLNNCTPANTAPTITAEVGVTRRQDAGVSNSLIATVSDTEDAETALAVTVGGSSSATVNGVSVSTIAIDSAGQVTANVAAACGATSASFTLRVTDTGSLFAQATLNVAVTLENKPPVINPISNVVVTLPLNSVATSMPVTFPLPTATDNCSAATVVTSPVSGTGFNVGTTTVNVTATDGVGNIATRTFTVSVQYNFTGFFQPVDNPPTFNTANAGQAIPVKFSLSGNKGANIFAAGYPTSVPIPCPGGSGALIEEIVANASGSFLQYDSGTDRYTYVWKTDASWAGTCRQLIVKLNDGITYYANFQFR